MFSGRFTLRDPCPNCGTRYAEEDGYVLGSYVVNLVFTELLAVGLVVYLIAGTDLAVLQMQLTGVAVAVAMPLLFYPLALLLWVALDATTHPPPPDDGQSS